MKKTTTHTASASTSAYPSSEAVLHYLWKTKQLPEHSLTTTLHQNVNILDWGSHNHQAGPDFLFASIELDGMQWNGHVEMHLRSSDWYRHHHQNNPAYDLVVLHVVWEDDRPVTDIHLTPIPTIELSGLVDSNVLVKAAALLNSPQSIPCASRIGSLNVFWLNTWKERQLIERMQLRSTAIINRLAEVHGDWEQVALEFLFRSMGFHANSDALQELAAHVTWPLIRKVSHDADALAALLFGSAGFLEDEATDDYHRYLKSTFSFLSNKYSCQPCAYITWNFKGCRPPNFPTIRLAQLIAMIHNKGSLLRSILTRTNLEEIRSLFTGKTHTYWQTHYRFGQETKKTRCNLSTASIDVLIINFVIPILYSYGQANHQEELKNTAMQLLYGIRKENNSVLKTFEDAGMTHNNAADSQALLHTYKHYCSQRRCLSCQVGCRVMKTE